MIQQLFLKTKICMNQQRENVVYDIYSVSLKLDLLKEKIDVFIEHKKQE